MDKITTATIRAMKGKEKISVLTAYDYSSALIYDEAGIEVLLVGDSLGMVVLGYESTVPVTLADMIHHGKAVVRGTKRAHVVVDMPFMSYHINRGETLKNAAELIQQTGASSVKLEGGKEIAESVHALTSAGIPVMGHLGLLPQSVNQLGGYGVQGKNAEDAQIIYDAALALEQAGAYAIVLECVPQPLAKYITDNITIPTIGIGAGVDCDGQVLVSHDMLGIYQRFTPKFVKQYNTLYKNILESIKQYHTDVKQGAFPSQEHSFSMKDDVLKVLFGGSS